LVIKKAVGFLGRVYMSAFSLLQAK